MKTSWKNFWQFIFISCFSLMIFLFYGCPVHQVRCPYPDLIFRNNRCDCAKGYAWDEKKRKCAKWEKTFCNEKLSECHHLLICAKGFGNDFLLYGYAKRAVCVQRVRYNFWKITHQGSEKYKQQAVTGKDTPDKVTGFAYNEPSTLDPSQNLDAYNHNLNKICEKYKQSLQYLPSKDSYDHFLEIIPFVDKQEQEKLSPDRLNRLTQGRIQVVWETIKHCFGESNVTLTKASKIIVETENGKNFRGVLIQNYSMSKTYRTSIVKHEKSMQRFAKAIPAPDPPQTPFPLFKKPAPKFKRWLLSSTITFYPFFRLFNPDDYGDSTLAALNFDIGFKLIKNFGIKLHGGFGLTRARFHIIVGVPVTNEPDVTYLDLNWRAGFFWHVKNLYYNKVLQHLVKFEALFTLEFASYNHMFWLMSGPDDRMNFPYTHTLLFSEAKFITFKNYLQFSLFTGLGGVVKSQGKVINILPLFLIGLGLSFGHIWFL